jgi:hypothetical protein
MEGTDLKARPTLVQKIMRPRSEAEEETEAYQEARARTREAIMFDVVMKDGTIESFDYASLRRVRYKPDGVLALRFGRDEVEVKGTNMKRLRELITEHRQRFIKEGTYAERDIKPEEAAHIESITFVDEEGEL